MGVTQNWGAGAAAPFLGLSSAADLKTGRGPSARWISLPNLVVVVQLNASSFFVYHLLVNSLSILRQNTNRAVDSRRYLTISDQISVFDKPYAV